MKYHLILLFDINVQNVSKSFLNRTSLVRHCHRQHEQHRQIKSTKTTLRPGSSTNKIHLDVVVMQLIHHHLVVVQLNLYFQMNFFVNNINILIFKNLYIQLIN